MLVLAGDIGGTCTHLAYFDTADSTLMTPMVEGRFSSLEAGGLQAIVGCFAAEQVQLDSLIVPLQVTISEKEFPVLWSS